MESSQVTNMHKSCCGGGVRHEVADYYLEFLESHIPDTGTSPFCTELASHYGNCPPGAVPSSFSEHFHLQVRRFYFKEHNKPKLHKE